MYERSNYHFNGKCFKNIDISENKQGVYILGIKQGNKVK
jgi:hypothetical protein